MPHWCKSSMLFAVPAGPSTPLLQDVYFCCRPRKCSHFDTLTSKSACVHSILSPCSATCVQITTSTSVLCGGISGKSFEAPCIMLQGIDHDSICLQLFHAACNTQLFQHTRCNSVACNKLHVTSCIVHGGGL